MPMPFLKFNHQKYLDELTKIKQPADDYQILLSAKEYKSALLNAIINAQKHIYIVSLYLEKDEAGQDILQALYQAKKENGALNINVIVDWHRAQRGRIGEPKTETNAGFYKQLSQKYADLQINYYGAPINRREVLGVLHLKGCIIDDTVIYSGASINNVYLHQLDKYRYDRYHIIKNKILANSMVAYLEKAIMSDSATQPINITEHKTRKELKSKIKNFRQSLAQQNYQFDGEINNDDLTVTPLVGLGKGSILNKVIHHLVCTTQNKIVFCTPYFNLPTILMKDVIRLLKQGKTVEFIIGDKTANDFYIPESEPFNISGGLPYLYEINLRKFAERLQDYINNQQLIIRLWQDETNSYHLKGIWVDEHAFIVTGNNINPRALRLDLENGILVQDPKRELTSKCKAELDEIRKNTQIVTHFQQIQSIQFYPIVVKKLITRLSRIRVDKIIKRLL